MKKIILKLLLVQISMILFAKCALYANEKITVLYTNSLNGYFDDCHCKDHPKGGLVMRAAEINKIRENINNVFLFETGDYYPPESDDLLADYLTRGFKYIKYDSFSIGDQEFSGGIDMYLKNAGKLPFICNNLMIKIKGSWEPAAERYRIIDKNKIKIGVIGTIADAAFKYYPKDLLSKIKVLDQEKEIEKDLSHLKSNGIDYIFLLSHSGYDRDRELANTIKDIDLIIGGHSQTLLKKPVKINDTLIVQAGSDGARIGILNLALSKGTVKIINNSFSLPYLPDYKEDKNIRKLIDEYNKEVEARYKKLKFK